MYNKHIICAGMYESYDYRIHIVMHMLWVSLLISPFWLGLPAIMFSIYNEEQSIMVSHLNKKAKLKVGLGCIRGLRGQEQYMSSLAL